MDLAALIRQDLERSGLEQQDLLVRPITNPERAATLTPALCEGYVIPYFSHLGRIQAFYRVRLFDNDPKYRQPKNTPNHVYYPQGFIKVLNACQLPYVIITEGEKKAARAVKAGIPCCALGGVDSWRNKIITIPGESALTAVKGNVQIKLPTSQDGEVQEDITAPLALGFQELIDLALSRNLHIIICFDNDTDSETHFNVQRAAAMLGFEFRFHGVPFSRVRQLILPITDKEHTNGHAESEETKVTKGSATDAVKDAIGLDDYIQDHPTRIHELIRDLLARKSAFPCHPNIRDFINKRLGRAKLSRKDTQNVGLAILSDLDAKGLRLRSPGDITYYFDGQDKKLLKATFAMNGRDDTFDAPFTQFLYQRYGLSAADNRLLVWLGTQFTSEEPIDRVSPYRVTARPSTEGDFVYLQLSDSEYAKVSSQEITVHDNGTNNILFESDQVDPIAGKELLAELARQSRPGSKLTNWWGDTLSEVRLKDKERPRVATSLLYYLSPFLHRWRGMQLPIELILGESGSGKSTLCALRLSILTGRANLRNAPQDLKDWHASVTSTGGLHVTDNVQFTNKDLRNRLSDEICRIVTEPDPFIEQRRYYTNADLIRIPVRCVFAVTAIQQPFLNADLLQRAMLLEFDKPTDRALTFNSDWQNQQLQRNGGRVAWVAHHLLVMQRFFQLVQKHWNHHYEAKHRLIHLEQSMLLMSQVFGANGDWIPNYLSSTTERVIAENDWVLEGIIAYCKLPPQQRTEKITAGEISGWATTEEEFMACDALTNARRLGRYLRSHKSLVATSAGLYEAGIWQNRSIYQVRGKPK
jgi:Domain of unknown function (DUF3854)